VMRYLLKMAGLPQTIEYNYLDSSGVQAGKLLGKAHILGLDRLIRGIHITPFQNFTSTEQYDYVVAMHSWYGIGNDESQIKKYCDMIADNGTGLFIIAPNNDFGGMLNKHFYGRLHGNRKGNHSYDISNRVRAQLLRHAESVNVDIMQEAVICKDDVIDCTANLTLLGRTLVEFFLMKQYESIPSDVRQDLTRFIQELPAYLDMTNYVFEVRK
ncbi:hypothetical protein JW868_04425, partial [Candidatus Woesearchaeota archaeon]|nr:hypothetical protein [Candidatus Woesearchaeota archaeon]